MPYKILEHTADIRMAVQGRTLEELFSDALAGMASILKSQNASDKKQVERAISLEAPDTTALLIDFLNETLRLAQTNKESYTQVEFKKILPQSLEANLRGFKVQSFEEDIKAVTYHEAEVKRKKDGIWETNIIFDI